MDQRRRLTATINQLRKGNTCGVDMEGGEAKLTAVEKAFTKNGSCGRAVLFLTPASKGTAKASVTYLCWTEEVYPE
jgi:hypothetical protein